MLGLKCSKLKLKTFLFIEVTFNISCHTIMTFTKKQKHFFDLQHTSHLQKWTTDLLIRKHVPNFKTPPHHPLPSLRMDVINAWPHTGKDLKKESEWWDCRLQWLKGLNNATHYFDSFGKSNICDKNKGQNILYDRGDVF